MLRILVLALVAACLVPATAPAAVRHWKVTADVTGSYVNDVTGTARCAAQYHEAITGLDMRFTAKKALAYDPGARALTGVLRYRVVGGTWAVSGSYVPLVAQPDGTQACAGSATPVSCGAKVVAEDGHGARTSGSARLAVVGTTRRTTISRLDGPRLTEQYADAGTPPAGWPSACQLQTGDETVPVAPLFGLASTDIADRQLVKRIAIPDAKLRGHRRFTVRVAAARPNGCPADGFDPCTETGAIATRVTFTPA
jgi:hypothetical protein